jgi:hypothetical protein
MFGLSEEGATQLLSLYSFVIDVSGGLESSFVERELNLLSAIVDGTALEHHLEPSYYDALAGAVGIKNSDEVGEET